MLTHAGYHFHFGMTEVVSAICLALVGLAGGVSLLAFSSTLNHGDRPAAPSASCDELRAYSVAVPRLMEPGQGRLLVLGAVALWATTALFGALVSMQRAHERWSGGAGDDGCKRSRRRLVLPVLLAAVLFVLVAMFSTVALYLTVDAPPTAPFDFDCAELRNYVATLPPTVCRSLLWSLLIFLVTMCGSTLVLGGAACFFAAITFVLERVE